jgi:hemolysin activation/secretion protein
MIKQVYSIPQYLILPKYSIFVALISYQSAAIALPNTNSEVLQHSALKIEKSILPKAEINLDRALPEIKEEPSDAQTVYIKSVLFSGNSIFKDSELQALIGGYVEKKHSFTGLRNIATIVTRHYRKKGYLMATAYVPAQDVSGQVLKISILEGLLGQLSFKAIESQKAGRIPKYFDSLKDTPLTSYDIERKLRLLNDRGIRVKATFSPGEKQGTTDLDLQTTAAPPIQGQLTIDNEGNEYTHSIRAGTVLQINNPFGYLGRHLVSFVTGGKRYKNLALNTDLPIGANGLTFNAGLNYTEYKLGKEFSILDANGSSYKLDIGMSYPWIRSLNKNIYSEVNYTLTQYDDKSLGSVTGDREIQTISSSLKGDTSKPGSRLDWALTASLGKVNNRLNQTETDDEFAKIFVALEHNQFLTKSLRLESSISSQFSNNNLSSSQKLSLGGSDGVRAYPQGVSLVDSGLSSSLELHYTIDAKWSVSSFVDAGSGKNKRTTGNTNISGIGAAASYRHNQFGNFNLAAAWRTGEKPTSAKDKKPRVWFQWVKPIN